MLNTFQIVIRCENRICSVIHTTKSFRTIRNKNQEQQTREKSKIANHPSDTFSGWKKRVKLIFTGMHLLLQCLL